MTHAVIHFDVEVNPPTVAFVDTHGVEVLVDSVPPAVAVSPGEPQVIFAAAAQGAPGPGSPFLLISQEDYDALAVKDPLILYVIADLPVAPSSPTVSATLSGAGVLAATASKAPEAVTITTTGATFSPEIELAPGSTATVHWAWTGGSTTGLTPTISFGSAATRTVTMTVLDGGADAIDEVVTFNLGFDNTEDGWGPQVLPVGYNHTKQLVSGVGNVNAMTGLVRFMAACPGLVGNLDFTGMSALTHIECYHADITGVTLTGCTSLLRLCLEETNLTTLDLNPVRTNLRDLRAANQQGNTLTMSPLVGPLTNLWHYCVRDQNLINHASMANLPVVEELWNWNTGQTTALVPVSGTLLRSIMCYSNNWSSVDFAGAVNLDRVWLSNSGLNQSEVDAILAQVVSLGEINGNMDLRTNAAPSSAGLASRTILVGRGWVVDVDVSGGGYSPAPTTQVFSDNFTRADAANLAAVNNGWSSPEGMLVNITSNVLNRTSSGSYQRLLNAGGVTLPADYGVEVTIPHAQLSSSYFFVVGRHTGGTGVRVGWQGSAPSTGFAGLTIGTANSFTGGEVTPVADSAFPASWSVNQDHVLLVAMYGTRVDVYADGVLVAHGGLATNSTATGTSFGIAGGNSGSFRRVRALTSSSTLFSDDFNRADAANLAAVGNGWSTPDGTTATITSNALNKTSTGSYQRLLNAGGGSLPADYSVTFTVAHASLNQACHHYLIARHTGGTGVRFGWNGVNAITQSSGMVIGTSDAYNANNATPTYDNAFPASWTVNQDHTVRMQLVGTLVNIYCDGVLVCHGTQATNSAATGTSVGVAGDAVFRYDSIVVTS